MTIRSHDEDPVTPLPAFLHMPTMLITSYGQEYSVAGDVWFLPEDPDRAAIVKFDWTLVTSVVVTGCSTRVMSERAVSLAKLYILERMRAGKNSIKPRSGKSIMFAILGLARWLAAHPEQLPAGREFAWSDLTADIFEAWLKAEYQTKNKGNAAILVRRFYLWGADVDAGFPDFSSELASDLSTYSIKKNAIGELVESRDSKRGPFTREELNLIFKACEAGAGKDHDRALVWILLETGIRPKQLYRLTNRDLEVIDDAPGSGNIVTLSTYRLRVGRLKRRGSVISYHFLPLSERCALFLLSLRKLGTGLDDPLFWWVSSFYTAHIEKRLKSFSVDADLRSPRLPIENPEPGGPLYERLPVSPRRFRYGLATDRITRGESPGDVAAMLGHGDTDTVHAYVETSPTIADDVQRATDYVIAPLIDLMEGRVKSSEGSLLEGAHPPVSMKLRPYDEAPTFVKGTATQYHFQSNKQSLRLHSNMSAGSLSWSDKSEARIKDLVARARRKFPATYPEQAFDGQIWDATHLKERTNVTARVRLGFTIFASTKNNRNGFSPRPIDALPDHFADVIKSWLVISNHVSLTCNRLRLYAARHFWDSQLMRQSGKDVPFAWGELSESDMLAFEQYLIAYRTNRNKPLSPDTILLLVEHLQSLVDFLANCSICRRIDYVPQTPSMRASAASTLDEKKLTAERKLPAPGVLESLGGIYHRLTTAPTGEVSDWMLIVISAVVILILTGLRIGELMTLPFNCEVEEKASSPEEDGSEFYYYGIRYWVEKAGKKMMRIKWISPTAVPVVRACVRRIKRLTAAARERAKVLEADPSTVALPPDIASRTTITRVELFALWGQKGYAHSINTDPQRLLPMQGKGSEAYYYVKDFQAYLMSRRVPHLHTIRHDDGTVQMLSESLFVIFAKQSRCSLTDPCLLLVEPVKAASIATLLSRPDGIFKTYGDADWQRELSANPHCFRHWLINKAYTGGMGTYLILRYFAKRYPAGIADYLHFSTDESDAYAPEELNIERFYIPV